MEVKRLMRNAFKMEAEAICRKCQTFETEEYAPQKIKDQKSWMA